ncbi:hypothetical protein GCM10027570_31310 [Streptomonospora sediminis]
MYPGHRSRTGRNNADPPAVENPCARRDPHAGAEDASRCPIPFRAEPPAAGRKPLTRTAADDPRPGSPAAHPAVGTAEARGTGRGMRRVPETD